MSTELQPIEVMDINGFKASIKKTKKLENDSSLLGIPSGTNIGVYPIERLPHAPKDWIREAGSYVVPVEANWGLSFDWSMNDSLNTAIMPSVKGINPITGLPINGVRLESYEHKCPKHDKPFLNNKFCEECGYSWANQNYVSAPNALSLSGFRQQDGKVRQFFFTEDERRDIASLIVGKENTVPAFGFAFYKTKVRREIPTNFTYPNYFYYLDYYRYWGYPKHWDDVFIGRSHEELWYNNNVFSVGGSNSENYKIQDAYEKYTANTYETLCSVSNSLSSNGNQSGGMSTCEISKPTKPQNFMNASVGIGAGAEMLQSFLPDPLGLTGWQNDPSATIRLYFCFTEQFEQMKSKGIKTFKQTKGFLEGLPVG